MRFLVDSCRPVKVKNKEQNSASVGKITTYIRIFGNNPKQNRHGTCNVMLRLVLELLVPWKGNMYYICVCVCMRVYAYVWVPGLLGLCKRLFACSLAYRAFNAYAPYCDVICGSSCSTIYFDIISSMARFSERSY